MPREVYQFVATGQDQVLAAFKSIASESQRTARSVAGAYKNTEKAAAVSGDRAAAAHTRASDKAAASAERSADKEAKARERGLRHVAGVRDRYFRDQQRLEERANATSERASQKRVQAEQRANQQIARERARTLGRVAGLAQDAAFTGVVAAGGLAAAGVGAAARQSLQLGEVANRLSVNARGAGQEFVDPRKLQKEFEATALGTPGLSAIDIAEATQGFVSKTGRLDVARAQQGTFATVASATGSDVRDISSAAADLFQKFDITGVEEMRDALAALTFQGKEGAFELKDAASQFGRLSAAASRFGLDKGAAGVRTLGGLTQIARSATGSPEQAATAVEATLRQLVAKSGTLKAQGVNVFDKKGQARPLTDVLVEAISKVGGTDIEKKKVGLQEVFGEEGIRAISPLISTFAEAVKRGGDGAQALRAQLDKAINAPGTWSDVVLDAAQAQKNSSAQLASAWEGLVAKVGQEFTPIVADLIGRFVKFTQETNVFDNVITIFVALGEAMQLLLDVLETFGYVKKKQFTPQEQIEKAEREIASIEAKRKASGYDPLSGTDVSKLRAARATVRDQNEILNPTPEAGALSNASKVFKDRTREEFVGEVAGFLKPIYGTEATRFAQQQAASLIEDPNQAGRISAQAVSPEHRAAIQQFAEQQTAARTLNQGGDSGAMNDAAKVLAQGGRDLSSAARDIRESAEKNRPSVIQD